MYDLHALKPEILGWVFDEAMNELHAYLCEVDFREMYGTEWPAMARETAADCRAVAQAATSAAKREAWLTLAHDYEGTIQAVP
jgi:hypothetical protein